jgi:DNA-binding NtrC family response regulator
LFSVDKHKILVVDDEATIRHVLKQMLSMKDCETRMAGSAEEATCILSDWEPDVTLADISMPGKSGIQLMEDIKQQYPDTEVLIMTSYSSTESVQRAIRAGAHDYLSKPFKLTEVWETIERALCKRRRSLEQGRLLARD